jgi:hypothetical protein
MNHPLNRTNPQILIQIPGLPHFDWNNAPFSLETPPLIVIASGG